MEGEGKGTKNRFRVGGQTRKKGSTESDASNAEARVTGVEMLINIAPSDSERRRRDIVREDGYEHS